MVPKTPEKYREYIHDHFLDFVFVFIENSCCHCWVSQYGRSFEIVKTPWRVRDKYSVV